MHTRTHACAHSNISYRKYFAVLIIQCRKYFVIFNFVVVVISDYENISTMKISGFMVPDLSHAWGGPGGGGGGRRGYVQGVGTSTALQVAFPMQALLKAQPEWIHNQHAIVTKFSCIIMTSWCACWISIQ